LLFQYAIRALARLGRRKNPHPGVAEVLAKQQRRGFSTGKFVNIE